MVFRSNLSGKGGVVAIHRSNNKARKIKHLDENIMWTTDRHDGALVHYITVYTPRNKDD